MASYLQQVGARLLISWMLATAAGLAWIWLAAAARRLLRPGSARDLFLACLTAAQAAIWVGTSLAASTAAPAARTVPVAVYQALDEAAHLCAAAGTAGTGLALVALGAAGGTSVPRWFARASAVAGVLLILTAVIGPISIPLTSAWLIAVAVVLPRSARQVPVRGRDNTGIPV